MPTPLPTAADRFFAVSPLRSSLSSDTLVYGTALVFERALGFVLLPLLARTLDGREYALWTQAAVLSSTLLPLATLGLPAALVKRLAGIEDPRVHRGSLKRVLAALLPLWLAFAAFAAATAPVFGESVYGAEVSSTVLLATVLLVIADAGFDVLTGSWRARHAIRSIAALMVARGALRCGLMTAALWLAGWAFETSFLLYAASFFVAMALLLLVWLKRLRHGEAGREALPASRLPALRGFAGSMLLLAALAGVHASADRFVLAHLLGLEPLAAYAAVGTLVSIETLAYTAIGFTLFPALARHWERDESAAALALARRAVEVYLLAVLPLVCWFAVAGDGLTGLIATPAYRAGSLVVTAVAAAIASYGLYQLALYLMLVAGHAADALWLLALAIAVNLALNVITVPHWGLAGAAFAALVSNAALAASAWWRAARRLRSFAFPWPTIQWALAFAAPALAGGALVRSWLGSESWSAQAAIALLFAGVYIVIAVASGALKGHGPLQMWDHYRG